MSDFWEEFNNYNIHHIRLNLTLINNLWDSAVHLPGLARTFVIGGDFLSSLE
jgi:hypothetical protein